MGRWRVTFEFEGNLKHPFKAREAVAYFAQGVALVSQIGAQGKIQGKLQAAKAK